MKIFNRPASVLALSMGLAALLFLARSRADAGALPSAPTIAPITTAPQGSAVPPVTTNPAAAPSVAATAAARPAVAHKSAPVATSAEGLDWLQLDSEALGYFRTYLRFDTSNPPGKTAAAIDYLRHILQREGIPSEVFSSDPAKPNLVARLPGSSNLKPLLLMSHVDVVPAVASDWSHPPFRADVAHGYVWGRGALDDKSDGIMALMTLIALHRRHVPLVRGVEMMVNSDEESGGDMGAQWMVSTHWEALDPAFAFNEGGTGTPNWMGASGTIFRIAVAEKRVMWLKLIAHGRAGHGSEPTDQNPNLILIRALYRVLAEQPPMRLTRIFRETAQAMAPRMSDPMSFEFGHLDYPLMLELAGHGPLSDEAVQAVLRDTIVPTMLDAGIKVNVIPSIAEATLDCRLLPGTDPGKFLDHINTLIDDPRVVVEFLQMPDRSRYLSPRRGPAWEAIKQVVHQDFPDALAVPALQASATDSRFLRDRRVPAYGLIPVVLEGPEESRIHGVDERISLQNFFRGLRVTYDLTTRLCARKP
jgi:acetylornithine deacetylase/succinyl-diaminopimelate desuccinylase-like protein